MASAAKRAKMASGEGALAAFLAWAEREGLRVSPKVCVSREGTVADYGLVAREDLEAGEVLFSVPRTALLSQHTSPLAPLLQKEHASLESSSGWVPLLLCLLHESTDTHSRWAPYLSLWPGFSSLDLPMFWSREERKRLLQGTGVSEAVERDLSSIQEEFSSVVLPFMKAHPDLFNPKVHTLELYKRLVAFVMAYSFQEPLDDEEEGEPNPPVMVPLADLLNHVANHNANLEYSPERLKMVATRPILKGQEIFNTYGELANWQLLHMYGFAEPYPGNTNDAADIPMLTLLQAALEGAKTDQERQLTLEQWDYLCGLEMVGEEGAFVVGWEGVLTEEELYVSLKVLTMPAAEFKALKEPGAAEPSARAGGQLLSKAALPALNPAWKRLLSSAALLALKAYRSDLKSEEETLQQGQTYARLSSRERHALQVRYGEKKVLHHLLQLLSA
ncbi:N-lysine methyltransferase SETD6 [Anolis sagrei]|uniref:N-lysine methyltransferase SETD6 n=1 Tax=Anolis sagrei TaxID=38937 RepID=UPI0035219024